MARTKSDNLTPLELEIMHVLWAEGPANVQTVQQKLPRELAYTTVQTMLNILHRKGKVKRALKERAYFYRPAVSRSEVVRHSVRDLVERMFGGSAESLVMSLIEDRHLTRAKQARRSGDNGGTAEPSPTRGAGACLGAHVFVREPGAMACRTFARRVAAHPCAGPWRPRGRTARAARRRSAALPAAARFARCP